MAYTDTTAVKLYLGIGTTGDDTLLAALITRAQAIIDSELGRTFEAASDTTRYFDACAIDGRDLILDKDLCAITSVTNGDGVVIASTKYTTMPRNEKPWYALRLNSDSEVTWDGTTGEIAIVGKWAYMATADNAIQHIAIRLTAWLYAQKNNNADIDRAMAFNNMTLLPAELPRDIAKLLNPYRRLTP